LERAKDWVGDLFPMVELSKQEEERALRLHREAVVVDTHCDTWMHGGGGGGRREEPRRLGERSERGHLDIPRMVEGGVTCQTFAVYTGRAPVVADATYRALQMVERFWAEADSNPVFDAVTGVEGIREAKRGGRVCGLLSLEGAEPLMGDVAMLRVFHRLGVRMVSLAWNWRTPFADGLAAKRSGGRLTDLGVEAVEEMARLGVLLDVSHLADSVFWDVVEVSKKPFIASHSNARAVCDHPRNLSDDMIEALAERGGVMGLNFAPAFVVEGGEGASVERLVDHCDHIVGLVGPDHVGLGSDYDGIGAPPRGLESVDKLPNFTRELVRRGYSDEDVLKILGGNHLRLFQKVIG